MKLAHVILGKIAELGEAALESFFPEKYPEARMWRELLGVSPSYKFSKPTFSTLLSRLRADGLITRKNSTRGARWSITAHGVRFLRKEQEKHTLVDQAEKDGIMRIVSFDIPERDRKKRRWLREQLLELCYEPLQKSVWLGFVPLSEDFFEEADLLALREHIHVFAVIREGTLDKNSQRHRAHQG